MSMKLKLLGMFLLSVGAIDLYAQTAKTIPNRALDQDLCLEVNDGGVPTSSICIVGSTSAINANLATVNATGDVCATAAGSGVQELSSCASSKRYKENIRPVTDSERDSVYLLRGVNFDWKQANGGHNDFGMIAEEVDSVLPQLAPTNENGEPETVNYKHMVGLLIEVVKDLNNRIMVLESTH